MFQTISYGSDIGGMCGLWIGLSSITGIQLLQLIVEIMAGKIRQLQRVLHKSKVVYPRDVDDSRLEMQETHQHTSRTDMTSHDTYERDDCGLTPVQS